MYTEWHFENQNIYLMNIVTEVATYYNQNSIVPVPGYQIPVKILPLQN